MSDADIKWRERLTAVIKRLREAIETGAKREREMAVEIVGLRRELMEAASVMEAASTKWSGFVEPARLAREAATQ